VLAVIVSWWAFDSGVGRACLNAVRNLARPPLTHRQHFAEFAEFAPAPNQPPRRMVSHRALHAANR